MCSIGLDLQPWVHQGLLLFHAARPTLYGLEMHLVTIHKLVQEYAPQVVIMDPITNLGTVGSELEVRGALMRLIDYFKSRGVTALFTSLTSGSDAVEQTQLGISSLMDTWVLLKMIETNGERNRGLYVLKARGIAHSNQVREFRVTDQGIHLLDVYAGTDGLLTGTARLTQEERDRAAAQKRRQEIERKWRDIERKRVMLEANIRALQVEFAAEEEEVQRLLADLTVAEQTQTETSDAIARQRGRDAAGNSAPLSAGAAGAGVSGIGADDASRGGKL
jgi:circadian clock protein KaiC